MAIFRQIHTRIWKDAWFCGLTGEQKFIFIYLFANESSSISGIYELPIRIICFETGLPEIAIKDALSVFVESGRIFYDAESSVIWVRNLRKYHETSSKSVQTRIMKDFNIVPDCPVKAAYAEAFGIDYGQGDDRVSIGLHSSSYSTGSNSGSSSAFSGRQEIVGREEEEPLWSIIKELDKGCSVPHGGRNHDKYLDTAYLIIGMDESAATPETVKEFFQWWKESGCWYDPPAPPSVKTVGDEWRKFLTRAEYGNRTAVKKGLKSQVDAVIKGMK